MIDESKIHVYDDYLEPFEHKQLRDYLLGPKMYWYYCGNYSGGYPQMERVFYNEFVGPQRVEGVPFVKNEISIFDRITGKMNFSALIRIRAICNWKTGTMSQRDWHVDVPFDCTTAIYYLHDSDALTLFKDGDNEPLEVETKANRLVEFPSQYQHTVTPMTTPERRVLVNFNFIRALTAKKDGETFTSAALSVQHPMS